MRSRISAAARNATRLTGLPHRTALAVVGGALAVLPVASAASTTMAVIEPSASGATPLVPPSHPLSPVPSGPISVDGSLPEPVSPVPLGAPGSALAPVAYSLPSGPLGIPGTALKAYRKAADLMAAERPGCHLDWALLASIGRIESNHARGGYVDANGTTIRPILGPVLNGFGPVAAIADSDGGRYDGDTVWDRAVGPSQFIPGTWRTYGADGNGDGKNDPNNIYDAALATARYLCSGGLDLSQPGSLRAAVLRYNNSASYADTVIRWAEAYRKGVAPLPDSTVPVGAPDVPAAPVTEPGPTPVPPPVTPPPGTTPPGTTPPGTTPPGSTPPSTPGTPPTTPTKPPSTPPTTPPTSPPTTPTTPPTTTPPPSTGPTTPPQTTSAPAKPPADSTPPTSTGGASTSG
ncbi:lytic transglycosylase domain-containing protein [Amycolatopsis minnesotensis]|uniref:Transglycosylase SLT domain-containing protein n=1 Tax=Amycolatopsis minnesotensis TaxID=337894 RepID=A0ABN2S8P2_9PSEU